MQNALPIFRALADPTRLRILSLVRRMELSVGELAQVLRQSQPRVSRHVKILADAGLIDRHKEGAWVFLRPGHGKAAGPAFAALDAWGVDVSTGDVERLGAVRAERVSVAEEYFAAHATEWDSLRTLHIAEAEVEAAIERALADRPLGTLLDIGTGTGRMIELLGPTAGDSLGIDRSVDMLRVARAKIEAAGLPRAQVRQADMYALPVERDGADTVILHQVLHFAHEPAQAIAEAARVLAPGGRLLIIDFAPHDREELRSQHAHTRLGFEDTLVCGWLAEAGLAARVADRLTGGPLTVTLWIGERAARPQAEAA
ncbi:ArsR/SmtB family transcription factor [Sphingoaurantiacus capsulatus]|uniref:ArsR/SmtB family transcription factor n=1 Tax=Sphingoaurantiacus capsulatus TaxID=1771310 RepID=A0ABV7XE94_9SPHN